MRVTSCGFEALTDPARLEDEPDLAIHVRWDADARTITVRDNGVGMSRQEVIDNIGTIAKSGTREFVEKLTGDRPTDARLIGQFGVGFYSAFIVAERVVLTTRTVGPRRRGRGPMGERGPGRIHHRAGRPRGARDGGDAAPPAGRRRAPRRLAPAVDPPQVLGPHHYPDPDAEGGGGRQAGGHRGRRHHRAGQPGVRAVGAAQGRDHGGAVPGVLQARRARLRAGPRPHPRPCGGTAGVHAAALRSAPRAVRLVGPRAAPRHQAVRAPRVHHGRRDGADAGVAALRARHHRFERPAAQRVARDPAGLPRCRRNPRGRGQARARAPRGPGRGRVRSLRGLLARVRAGPEGGCRTGRGQPGARREAAPVRVHPHGPPRSDGVVRRLSRPCEAGSGTNLLRHRGEPSPRLGTVPTWRSSARRASRSCCSTTGSTNGW